MTLHDLTMAAAELVDAIGDQAARDRDSFDAGYRYAARAFYDLGFEAGRQAAEEAFAQRWAPVAEHVHRIANQPGLAELQARRAEPGNLWRFARGQDSTPDAFTAGLIRRGVYEGGPVDWETGRPLTRAEAAA